MEPVRLREQTLGDDRIPFIPNEAPIAETSHSFDARVGARDEIIPNEEPLEPVIPELRRLASTSQVKSPAAPSRVRRTLRAARRFCLAILIGVAITLIWQSYGEEVKVLIASRVPALAVFFSGTTNIAATKGGASTKDTVSPQAAARTELASSLFVAGLNTVSQNLTDIQRTLDQLAAKQEVITQSIAALQPAENEIGGKLTTQATQPLPPKKKAPVTAPAHVSQGQPSPAAAGAPASGAPLSLTR